jgi:hypothetical protein
MIDFAHSFPSDHLDEMYLFGLKNLLTIFQNFDKELGTVLTSSNEIAYQQQSAIIGNLLTSLTPTKQ